MPKHDGIDLPVLTARRQSFVDWVVSGLSPTAAARKAGYEDPSGSGRRAMDSPDVQEHIQFHQRLHLDEMAMTREKIQEGLLEAINLAKEVQDPGSMIRGWSEIARLTGLNAPEKKEIDLKVDPNGQIAVKQLEQMPTTQLLELAGGELDVIDGDFEEIFDQDVR